MEIIKNKTVHEHFLIKKCGSKFEPEVKNTNEITVDDVYREKNIDTPDPEKCLLWKLSLNRKDAFERMNADVDEIVNQCLRARRHLQAVEDSNSNLKTELRSLKTKYEDLLEKNRKDTRIIMRLKDSESKLKESRKKREDTNEALQEVRLNNQEKFLERQLLRDNLAQLLLKSQTTSNCLKKINLKHERIYDMIEEENRRGKECQLLLSEEMKELRLYLARNDLILEKWLENNDERNAAIRSLQHDIEKGLEVQAQKSSSSTETINEETDKSDATQSDEAKVSTENEDSRKGESSGQNQELDILRRDWMKNKVLYEVAEKLKKHWMTIFKMLTKRMQNLSIEVVNVREWRIDLEAEKLELLAKAQKLEQLVSQKRRMKPVPPREPMDELNIQIKELQQANEMIRKIASKCLSLKVDDSEMYSKFSAAVKDTYLETLRKDPILKLESKLLTQNVEDQAE